MLEFYCSIEKMMMNTTSTISNAVPTKKLQTMLRPVLRDIAQTILVCFFISPNGGAQAAEVHRMLLAQLVQECEDVQKLTAAPDATQSSINL